MGEVSILAAAVMKLIDPFRFFSVYPAMATQFDASVIPRPRLASMWRQAVIVASKEQKMAFWLFVLLSRPRIQFDRLVGVGLKWPISGL